MMPADLSRRAGDAVRELVRLGALRSAWLPGMRGLWSDTVGRSYAPRAEDHFTHSPWMNRPSARPDTDDPLTVFGLLLLAREAWNEPEMSVQTDCGEWWCGSAFTTDRGFGTTEAEAVVAALEAAVEASRG